MSTPNYRDRCLSAKDKECELCGRPNKIDVHHIDGDRTNNHITNLMPVCRECHMAIHNGANGFEDYYEQLEPHSRFDQRMANITEDSRRISIDLPLSVLRPVDEIASGQAHTKTEALLEMIRRGIWVDMEHSKLPGEIATQYRKELDGIYAMEHKQLQLYKERIERLEAELREVSEEKRRLEREIETRSQDLTLEEVAEQSSDVIQATAELANWLQSVEARLDDEPGKWQAEGPSE